MNFRINEMKHAKDLERSPFSIEIINIIILILYENFKYMIIFKSGPSFDEIVAKNTVHNNP